MEHAFDASAWAGLGDELGMPQLGDPELRLQKSLRFGDDDYGYCVAQFVRHLEAERPDDLRRLAQRPKVRAWLDSNAPGAAQELEMGQAPATPANDSASASAAVEQALMDAHRVLEADGPVSCIHHVHDAFRGYLLEVSGRADPPSVDDATVAQLYWSLACDHPVFAARIGRSPQVGHVLASLAEAMTALNTLRNGAPTEQAARAAPEDAEAVLMTDLVRTLFNYMRGRLQ